MEVKKVQEKRKELEQSIYDLICKFERETETHITFISLQILPTIGERGEITTGARVSLEI